MGHRIFEGARTNYVKDIRTGGPRIIQNAVPRPVMNANMTAALFEQLHDAMYRLADLGQQIEGLTDKIDALEAKIDAL
jgi:hypothetical protein